MANDYLANLSDEEIVKIETKLFKTYSRLAAIVDSSNDAIVSMDTTNSILSWNKAAELMYGYKTGEVVTRNITLLWPKESESDASELIKQTLKGVPIKDYETVHVKKDGTKIFSSLTLSPIKDEMDLVSGVSMISRDITEKKSSEEKLSKYDEVSRLNKLMIDREVRMVELKQQIKDLENKLNAHEQRQVSEIPKVEKTQTSAPTVVPETKN